MKSKLFSLQNAFQLSYLVRFWGWRQGDPKLCITKITIYYSVVRPVSLLVTSRLEKAASPRPYLKIMILRIFKFFLESTIFTPFNVAKFDSVCKSGEVHWNLKILHSKKTRFTEPSYKSRFISYTQWLLESAVNLWNQRVDNIWYLDATSAGDLTKVWKSSKYS